MNNPGTGHSLFLNLIYNMDRSYRLKRKRLRFMNLAAVNRQIRDLEGVFLNSKPTSDDALIKLNSLSDLSLDILMGILGKHNDAETILAINLQVLDMDPGAFRRFLDERIDSAGARRNLFALMYDGDKSIASLTRQQVPYLEKYIPTLRFIDRIEKGSFRLGDEHRESIRHLIANFDLIRDNLSADISRYRRFMRDFRPLYHEHSNLSIIGYGEISTVMELSKGTSFDRSGRQVFPEDPQWIWKKLPPFGSFDEVLSFEKLYMEYREIITDRAGIKVPEQRVACFPSGRRYIVYAGQKRVDTRRVCHHLIRELDIEDGRKLFSLVLSRFSLLHGFNNSGGPARIGFDGQLSNWVHIPRNEDCRISDGDDLLYLDTSSPLIRIDGKEQLNVELFIRNSPSFLRFILKTFFLDEVVDRYYDLRSVIIDLIANLHKEKRPDLIDDYISMANDFIAERRLGAALTRKEIDTYYSRDAGIWRFYQAARRIDRFFIEKILRKKYALRLPGKVDR